MKHPTPFCNCLYFSANALARALHAMAENEFARVGLSPSHAFLLMTIDRSPGIYASQIAHNLELKPSTVTRLMDRMERESLLRRTVKGRVTEVRLTVHGKRRIRDIEKSWQGLYRRYGEILGEGHAARLTGLIHAALAPLGGLDNNTIHC